MAYDDRYDRTATAGAARPNGAATTASAAAGATRCPAATARRPRPAARATIPITAPERYGPGGLAGDAFGQDYGRAGDLRASTSRPATMPSFGGPRFDRVDVGSTGTHGVHPVSSTFGGDYSGPFGVLPGGGFGSSARRLPTQRHGHRSRIMRNGAAARSTQLDRDYDEYRREHQSRFDQEFGAWREKRRGQRAGARPGHRAYGGGRLGRQPCRHGRLARAATDHPHQERRQRRRRPPCHPLRLDRDGRRQGDAQPAPPRRRCERWRDEDRSRALFEREDQRPRAARTSSTAASRAPIPTKD